MGKSDNKNDPQNTTGMNPNNPSDLEQQKNDKYGP